MSTAMNLAPRKLPYFYRLLFMLLAALLAIACGGTKKTEGVGNLEEGLAIAEKRTVGEDEFEAAKKLFEAEISKNPNDARAMAALAKLYLKVGRIGDAKRWYERALNADPNNGMANAGLAELLIRDKQWAEAEGLLRNQLEKVDAPEDVKSLRLTLGSLLMLQEKYPEAKAELAKVLQIDNFNIQALLKLAFVHIKLGDKDRARLLLVNYQNNKSDDPRIGNMLATMAIAEKKYPDAIELLNKVIEQDKTLLDAYQNLASIYLRFGNYAAAENICNKGLEVDKNKVDLQICIARAQLARGNADQALARLQELHKKTNIPALRYEMGMAYWKLGKLREALDAINSYKIEDPKAEKAADEAIVKIEQTIADLEEQKRQEEEQKRLAEEELKRQAEEAKAREEAEKQAAEEAARMAAEAEKAAAEQSAKPADPAAQQPAGANTPTANSEAKQNPPAQEPAAKPETRP